MNKTAIVTGANRGIGLEIARQLSQRGLTVVLAARDAAKGEAAAQQLRAELGLGDEILSHPLDVADERSVQTLRSWAESELGQVDVLVNNAGILPDREKTALTISSALMREVLETNTLGPMWLCQAFMPGMLERNYGRIVNVASESAQLKNQRGRWPAYNLSKLALNALTMQFAGLRQKKMCWSIRCILAGCRATWAGRRRRARLRRAPTQLCGWLRCPLAVPMASFSLTGSRWTGDRDGHNRQASSVQVLS